MMASIFRTPDPGSKWCMHSWGSYCDVGRKHGCKVEIPPGKSSHGGPHICVCGATK